MSQSPDGERCPRAVIIATVPQTVRTFLSRQIGDLGQAGFDLQAISSPGPDMDAFRTESRIPFHAVSMTRRISPLRDCAAIWRLTNKLREIKPDIVQTHTPKAGMLGMIAAAAAGVPVRIYTVNGLLWESVHGWRGFVLRIGDRIAAHLATRILCVSRSVHRVMLANCIAEPTRIKVLGSGGSHGVDLRKFDPRQFSDEQRQRVRERHGLPFDGLVVGFVGRFVPDKGFETLLAAWRSIRNQSPKAALFLVGGRESSHPIPELLWAEVVGDPRISVGRADPDQMPEIYSAMDILVLPTLREGLPNVLLEAGSMEVPVVATRATGCVDVVLDGETGLLVPIGDVEELAAAIVRLAASGDVRRRMGKTARMHVAADFSEQTVSARLVDEYRRLLADYKRA